jgi:hypothetical protein
VRMRQSQDPKCALRDIAANDRVSLRDRIETYREAIDLDSDLATRYVQACCGGLIKSSGLSVIFVIAFIQHVTVCQPSSIDGIRFFNFRILLGGARKWSEPRDRTKGQR